MITWLKDKWDAIGTWFITIIDEIVIIPINLVKSINSVITGLNVQLSSAKGATIFLVVILALFDVWKKGAAGIIQFTLNVVVKFIADILKAVETTGLVQLCIVAILFAVFLEYKKAKK